MSSIARRTVPFLFAVLLAAACGNESSAAESIASLDDTSGGAAATGDGSAAVDLRSDETALAFSECIRGEGIDFPDIGLDADGNIDLRDAFQSSDVDPRSEEFRGALDACASLLEGTAFGGGGGRAALGDNPELSDAFVAYSDCIRDQGFDVGDLTFGGLGGGLGGGDGAVTPPADGELPARGAGARQGGFGDPNVRFAQQLGLDPDDPAVAAALEECAPIIQSAFADSGFGPGTVN